MRGRHRRSALVALMGFATLALVVEGAGSSPGRATLGPQTVVTFPGDVDSFAQDGEFMAWAQGGEGLFGAGVVEIYNLPASRRTLLGRAYDIYEGDPNLPLDGFALAGTRVLLADLDGDDVCSNTECTFQMYTAALDDRPLRNAGYSSYSDANAFSFLPPRIPVAGDGSTLAYFDCSGYECGKAYSTIRRIVRGHDYKVANSPYPTALATDAGRIAAAVLLKKRTPARSEISIWAKGVARFRVAGKVLALALSGSRVALLARDAGRTRLEVRRAGNGSLERRLALPDATRPSVSIAGPTVVFQVGQTVRVLDARTGRISSVAVVEGHAIGLSIEGVRVAWAERFKNGPDRVRALILGRS